MGSVWIFYSYSWPFLWPLERKSCAEKRHFANIQSMLPLTSFDTRNITTLKNEACSAAECNMARTMDMVFKSVYLIKILIFFFKEEFLRLNRFRKKAKNFFAKTEQTKLTSKTAFSGLNWILAREQKVSANWQGSKNSINLPWYVILMNN